MSAPGSKPIRLSARGYLVRRGFTEAVVVAAIRTGTWLPTGVGRWETAKEFAYNSLWNGKLYATKRVRPIFVDTAREIVVVTVCTYSF